MCVFFSLLWSHSAHFFLIPAIMSELQSALAYQMHLQSSTSAICSKLHTLIQAFTILSRYHLLLFFKHCSFNGRNSHPCVLRSEAMKWPLAEVNPLSETRLVLKKCVYYYYYWTNCSGLSHYAVWVRSGSIMYIIAIVNEILIRQCRTGYGNEALIFTFHLTKL